MSITYDQMRKNAYQVNSNGVMGCSNLHNVTITVRPSTFGRKVYEVECNDCGRQSVHLEYAKRKR